MLLTSTSAPASSSRPLHHISSSDAALTLLGPSQAMSHMWSQVRRLAPHVRTLLLLGQPDCGQEAVARLLLDLSAQSHRMFVSLHAFEAEARLARQAGFASLPTEILLFLPDVDNFSPAAQEALLRLIRMRRSRPFTLVAAAADDLRGAVSLGKFLPELAEVLGAVRLTVPTLEQRREDLPMLINHLLTEVCRECRRPMPQITEGFLRAAMAYGWPGNLRELTQVLATLLTRNSNEPIAELRADDLPCALARSVPSTRFGKEVARLVPLDTVMHEHIGSVLRACRGNKLRAAEVLGISRSTLYRMLDAAAAGHGAPLQIAG